MPFQGRPFMAPGTISITVDLCSAIETTFSREKLDESNVLPLKIIAHNF